MIAASDSTVRRGQLLRVMLIPLPGPRFLFIGDSGYGIHGLARFCHGHRARLALVCKLRPVADLFDRPLPSV